RAGWRAVSARRGEDPLPPRTSPSPPAPPLRARRGGPVAKGAEGPPARRHPARARRPPGRGEAGEGKRETSRAMRAPRSRDPRGVYRFFFGRAPCPASVPHPDARWRGRRDRRLPEALPRAARPLEPTPRERSPAGLGGPPESTEAPPTGRRGRKGAPLGAWEGG